MSDIQHLIGMLKNDNPNIRYDACEELRVARHPLPQEAMDALHTATNDSNPEVADAAQRAIAIHVVSVPSKVNTIDQTDIEKSDLAHTKYLLANGLIVGGVAGFVGGFLRFNLMGSFYFGIPMLCVGMPIFSPLAGVLSVFLFSYFLEKSKPGYLLFCALIGFLAGSLPFNYWFAL